MKLIQSSIALLCAACAAPRAAHQTIAEATADYENRVPELEILDEALRLADLEALSIHLPSREEIADPRRDAYWHASAYAFAPKVRDARSAVLATLALEGAAGAPDPVAVRFVDHEFGGDDTLFESVATWDLLGLLGAGPNRAQRELAEATSLARLANLGLALWEAPFAVDRARIALETASLREERLAALLEEARSDLARVQLLAERGRIGASPAAMARGQVHAIEAALDAARQARVAARAQLAREAGLPPERVRQTPAWGLLARPHDVPAGCDPDHPVLRSARLELALAEARLRAVAAQAWPNLRFGPHLAFPSGGLDPLRLGGVFAASVPTPARYEGPMEAAAVERDRALERYAERVWGMRLNLEEAIQRAQLAGDRERSAGEVEAASASAWRAVRAGFQHSRSSVGEWSDALERRRGAIEQWVQAHSSRALAQLETQRVAGPHPEPEGHGRRAALEHPEGNQQEVAR